MNAATANFPNGGTTYSDCAKVKLFLKGIRQAVSLYPQTLIP